MYRGKPEEKKQLGRPRHRWEDGIKMELGRFGPGREEVWSGLAWLRIGSVGGLL